MFVMSSQTSITLQANPLISFSELSLPLPERDAAWSAASATEWQEIYTKGHVQPSSPLVSLLDCTRSVLS